MKLQEKFDELDSKKVIREDVYNHNSKQCEEIADEYAIQFAEYVYARPNIFNNGSSMKQVLSLFKIENNL